MKTLSVLVLFGVLFGGAWFIVHGAPTLSPPNGNPATSYFTLSGTSLYPTSTAYNLGIGTASPANKLDISGSGDGLLSVSDTSAPAIGVGGSILFRGISSAPATYTIFGKIKAGKTNATDGHQHSYMTLSTVSSADDVLTERMRINSEGNVGIATTTPGSPLTVAGVIYSSTGGFKFPDGTTQTTAGAATIAAANVSSDVFGRLQGEGNFAFPAGLGVGTSTTAGMPTNGLYVNGSVGIGTASPLSKLFVDGGAINVGDGAGSYSGFQFSGGKLTQTNNNAVKLLGALQVTSTAGEDSYITGTGKVGIGTSTPSQKFTVAAGGRLNSIYAYGNEAGLTLESTAASGHKYNLFASSAGSTSGAGALAIYDETAGAYRFVMNSSGNVGIATTTPGSPLTVAGAIYSSTGGFKFPDGTTQTTAAGALITAIKTADETVNNSAVLQNDDHLAVSVAANTNYIFELYIIGQQKDGTAQLQAGFTVPSGTTMNHDDLYSSGGSGSFYNWHGTGTTFQQNWTLTNDHVFLQSKGIIQTSSAAGTIQLQWAQANARANDLKFLKGSYLKLTKI